MHRLLTLLFLLLPATLLAQQPDTLRRGLLVGYGSNLSFGSFSGGSVSLKMEKSATHALRFGVGVALDGFNSDRTEMHESSLTLSPSDPQNTSTNAEDITSDIYSVQVDVVVEVERYPEAAGRMRPYVLYGAFVGPRFSTRDGDTERNQPNQHPSTLLLSDDVQTYAWGGGLTGGLGVEWSVAGDLSLLAEYRTRLFYERKIEKRERTQVIVDTNANSETYTSTVTDRTRQADHQYGLRSDGLRVGAVLYF